MSGSFFNQVLPTIKQYFPQTYHSNNRFEEWVCWNEWNSNNISLCFHLQVAAINEQKKSVDSSGYSRHPVHEHKGVAFRSSSGQIDSRQCLLTSSCGLDQTIDLLNWNENREHQEDMSVLKPVWCNEGRHFIRTISWLRRVHVVLHRSSLIDTSGTICKWKPSYVPLEFGNNNFIRDQGNGNEVKCWNTRANNRAWN